jgi:uncharacterized protein
LELNSYEKAVHFYQLAADQGYSDAQLSLDRCFKHFLLSAQVGNPVAQFNVACCYSKGIGIEPSHEKAFQFYKLAAQQGHAAAQYNLGAFHEKGIGTEQSYEKAVYFYQIAAKQGHPLAQFNLGLSYKEEKELSNHTKKQHISIN